MQKRRGIILAGGTGSRLYPITYVTCKQLVDVAWKLLIYYPLSMLMLAGIRDVLIISTPDHLPLFQKLFGDGSGLGMNITYAAQQKPRGLADAFIIGKDFLQGEDGCLILGDNVYFGAGLTGMLRSASSESGGARIFLKQVPNAQDFGVVTLDDAGTIVDITEKPEHPSSDLAATGLYFVDGNAAEIAQQVAYSRRGELEIVSVLNTYLERNALRATILPFGSFWFDTGTLKSLRQARNVIETFEDSSGRLIGCIEEIAYQNGWISQEELVVHAVKMVNSSYGDYLLGASRRPIHPAIGHY